MRRTAAVMSVGALIATATAASHERRIHLPHHRVSVVIPAGWHLTRQRVNGVADPVTVFTASTFALHVRRADRAGVLGICSRALQRAWRPDGAYVQLTEERDGTSRRRMLRRVARRPRHFRLTSRDGGGLCTPPNSGEIVFQAGGRAFYVFYGIGPKASRATRANAEALLDSLRIAPRA